MSEQGAPLDRDEKTAEARNVETKYRENTSTRPIRANAGKAAECPEMKFGGKESWTSCERQIQNIGIICVWIMEYIYYT